jgi:hypothetical protein
MLGDLVDEGVSAAVQPQRWRCSWRVLRMPFLITALARQRGQRGMAGFVGGKVGMGGG